MACFRTPMVRVRCPPSWPAGSEHARMRGTSTSPYRLGAPVGPRSRSPRCEDQDRLVTLHPRPHWYGDDSQMEKRPSEESRSYVVRGSAWCGDAQAASLINSSDGIKCLKVVTFVLISSIKRVTSSSFAS